MKRYITFCITLLLFLLLGWPCRKLTDGFTLTKISSSLSFHPEWEVPPLPKHKMQEVNAVLSQPFTYLAKGAQCFVFLSQDGKYVLKFFRHSHLRAPFWAKALPSAFCKQKTAKKEGKLHKDFASYVLAFQELKEETGLVWLHLNKTASLHQTVTLIDKLGIAHSVDIDQMECLLQRRATLLYPTLEMWIRQHEEEKAAKALFELIELLYARARKGIFDKDPDLNTNFGFLEGHPIQIDIGRFKKAPVSSPYHELLRITDHLHQWLQEKSPPLASHLKNRIEELSM